LKAYLGEARVRNEIEIVLLPCRSMLDRKVLVGTILISGFAFEDIRLAFLDLCINVSGHSISGNLSLHLPLICAILYRVRRCPS